MFAQLAGDEKLDEIQEADRQVTIDGGVFRASRAASARSNVPALVIVYIALWLDNVVLTVIGKRTNPCPSVV